MLLDAMASALTALWFWASVASAERVDAVLSVVGTQVVTESDVAFEVALAQHDVSPFPPFEDPRDPVEVVEDYRRLRSQAGDVRLFRPEPEAVDARLAAFRDAFETREDYEAFLVAWQLDESALREHIFGRMVVENYVRRALGDAEDPVTWSASWETWIAAQRRTLPSRRLEQP